MGDAKSPLRYPPILAQAKTANFAKLFETCCNKRKHFQKREIIRRFVILFFPKVVIFPVLFAILCGKIKNKACHKINTELYNQNSSQSYSLGLNSNLFKKKKKKPLLNIFKNAVFLYYLLITFFRSFHTAFFEGVIVIKHK